jgi:signal transduction histidine kinase
VLGDSDRLQQVLWNLLANAIKFTPAGGSVSTTVTRAGPTATITVTDSGEGISEELLPFIFDRFRQGDSSVTRPHGGLGLGLSIVRHIVELHGGKVQAWSAGTGQGATFSVHLPVHSTRERASANE